MYIGCPVISRVILGQVTPGTWQWGALGYPRSPQEPGDLAVECSSQVLRMAWDTPGHPRTMLDQELGVADRLPPMSLLGEDMEGKHYSHEAVLDHADPTYPALPHHVIYVYCIAGKFKVGEITENSDW